MARPRKYTKKSFEAAVDAYFASISRTVTATEIVETDERDENGHRRKVERPILNDAGEEIRYTEYVLPPTVAGLCEYLGISRQTWANYCAAVPDNPFLDTTTRAQGRRRAYLEGELLRRRGGDVRGIMFDLQNNCGYSARVEVETGERASGVIKAAAMPMEEKERLLREVARMFAEGEAGDADAGGQAD